MLLKWYAEAIFGEVHGTLEVVLRILKLFILQVGAADLNVPAKGF
jgi:hypothetical protein